MSAADSPETPAQRRAALEVTLDLAVPEHVLADVAAALGIRPVEVLDPNVAGPSVVTAVLATYAATLDRQSLDEHSELVGSTATRLLIGPHADRAITAVLANLARARRIETALVAELDEVAAGSGRMVPAAGIQHIIASGGAS